jgi:hypothetical protein
MMKLSFFAATKLS